MLFNSANKDWGYLNNYCAVWIVLDCITCLEYYNLRLTTCFTVASTLSSSIEILNATNFKSWKHDIMINLGIMDLDLALREDQPVITPTSTLTQIKKAENGTNPTEWHYCS